MDRTWAAMGLVVVGAFVVACDEEGETGGGGATTATTASHGGETSLGGNVAQGGSGQGGSEDGGGSTTDGGSSSNGGATSEGGSSNGGATSAGGHAGQGGAAMACDEPNPDGAELVELVNAYRESEGLPAIPYSPSLSCVAVTHVHDLAVNAPHTEPGGCNLHSWSDQGTWTPCCYTPDHAQAACMWQKPQELTDYTGYGYENAAAGASSPAGALAMWQGSSAHNDVILNQGIWASHPWHAVGAGLYQGYATLWFGEQSDPAR